MRVGSHAARTPRHTGRGYYDDAVGKIPEILHRRICLADGQAPSVAGNPVIPCARFFVGTLPRELYRPLYRGGQGVVRGHAAEASRNQYGGIRFYHPFAYGMDVHDVRGTADALRAPAGNGGHPARLHSV